MRAAGDREKPAIPIRVTIILGLALALASILSFTHAVRMATHIVSWGAALRLHKALSLKD